MMNVAMIIRSEATRSETSHQAISAPWPGTAVHGVRKSTRGSQPIGGRPCHADSSRHFVASNCTGHKRGTSSSETRTASGKRDGDRSSCIGAALGSGSSISLFSEAQLRGQRRETAAHATDQHYAKNPHMSADAVEVSGGAPAASAGSPDVDGPPPPLQATPLRPLPEGIEPGGVDPADRTSRSHGSAPDAPATAGQEPS